MEGIGKLNSSVVNKTARTLFVQIAHLLRMLREKFFVVCACYLLKILKWTLMKKNLLASAEAACSNSLMWESTSHQVKLKVGTQSGRF